jgi:Histone methylation protein DOT1
MNHHQHRRLLLSAIAVAPLPFEVASAQPAMTQSGPVPTPTEAVPYVQTPPLVVRRMLQMADVNSRDVLWDLGSGDGRIVIAAATQFGARGVGYEIDPALIRESRLLAQKAGVAARAKFMEKDLFELAFAEPSVVTLYLLPEFNMKLRPLLLSQMRPGARVVSHEWDMGDWRPDETLLVPSPEKPHGTHREHKVMLWVIPAPIAGQWRVETASTHAANGLAFDVAQRIQEVTATAATGKLLWAHLRGTALSMAWSDGALRWALRGEVVGNLWRGEVQRIGNWANTSNAPKVRFLAKRTT